MKAEKILTNICANKNKEWNFIQDKLTKNEIDQIAKECENLSEGPDITDMFGFENDTNYAENCYQRLMRCARKKMWGNITKEQANAVLKSMQEIGAASIKMPDGGDYTPKDIVECWKWANEKEEGEEEEAE